VTKPYSLLDTIAQQIMEGRTAIVLEVARLSPVETPEMLAERCVNYVEWGKKCFPYACFRLLLVSHSTPYLRVGNFGM
jgi:hypothetical protein